VNVRHVACGLPHISANCQFVNIMPEKCIFERAHYKGREEGERESIEHRVDASTLSPPAMPEGWG